jgi:hypothetical protein
MRLLWSYILLLKIKLTKINHDFIILDTNGEYKKYENSQYYYSNVKEELMKIKTLADSRLDLFNKNNCQDIFEYNEKYKENLDIKFIYIINFESLKKQEEVSNILLYLLQIASNCGYYFIVHYSDNEQLSSIEDSLFSLKILGKNSLELGEYYIGINPVNYLYDDEAFFLYRDELFRYSLAKGTDEEIGKIINY